MNNCPMGPSCHGLQALNGELDKYIAQGMTREQIRAAFVAEHGGQDILTAPIDEGFNRLAWLLPYAVAATGACIAGFAAFRWSHRDGTAGSSAPARSDDPVLGARLDDELRDLD
jgi:cytochrome c-type biogenesis protein CcmH/NrfF